MIHIYLCDDEEAVLHQIQTALEWKIFMENYDMKVVCAAGCAQALLEAVEDNRRSVYFLDVDLKDGEWDGFRLGRELRRRKLRDQRRREAGRGCYDGACKGYSRGRAGHCGQMAGHSGECGESHADLYEVCQLKPGR